MKFSVERLAFIETLNIVKITQGTGQQNEWTKGIKVETVDGTNIKLSSSDTSASINVAMPATVTEQGKTLLGGKLLEKLVAHYVDSSIDFNVEENAVIKCGRDSGQYAAMQVDDFVDINIDTNGEGWFDMPVDIIAIADSKVRFAAANISNARPKMASVYFTCSGGKLEIVALDGCKLARYSADLENVPDFSILIPAETLAKICKAIKGKEITDKISMNIQNDKVYFHAGSLLISASLIDQAYVNYNKIIPQDVNFSVSFDKRELERKIALADVANQCSADSGSINYIGINMTEEGFGQGYLSIVNAKNVVNQQIGEIPFVQESGEIPQNFCMWVNPSFMGEILKNIDGDTVLLEIVSDKVPFKLKAKDGDDSYITLIMPKVQKPGEDKPANQGNGEG